MNRNWNSSSINLPRNCYPALGILSLILGLAVISTSAYTMSQVQHLNTHQDDSGSSSRKGVSPILVIAIIALIFQCIASLAMMISKQRETRNQVVGFICGQFFIQILLIICLALALYEIKTLSRYESGERNPTSEKASSDASTHKKLLGFGFWIPLLVNIIFHILVVSYLVIAAIKLSTGQSTDNEEMTAIVVHRRVPSKIPKDKRYGLKPEKPKK